MQKNKEYRGILERARVRLESNQPNPSTGKGTNIQPASPMTEFRARQIENELGLPTGCLRHVGMNLWQAVVVVSPAMAYRWLSERNTKNRDPIRYQWESISTDVESGDWWLTHQGIGFDEDGIIIDAQHRLTAVLVTWEPIAVVLTVNVPRNAVKVLDLHRRRRARDQALFMGKSMTAFDEAIVRRAVTGMVQGNTQVTVSVMLDFLERYRTELEAVMNLFDKVVRGIIVAPLVAGVFRAWLYHRGNDEAHARLALFAKIMVEGRITSDDDSDAILLRDWLSAPGRATRRNAQGSDVYARCIRAIDAFLKKERLKTLYAASKELFPLPDDIPLEKSQEVAPDPVGKIGGQGEEDDDAPIRATGTGG